MEGLDYTHDYTLREAAEWPLREILSGLHASDASQVATQAAHGRDIDRLWNIALLGGIVVAVLLVGLAAIGGAAWFANRARKRDCRRNAELITAQEKRLDAQEKRMTGVIDDLANTVAELRKAVSAVDSIATELRSDVGRAAETLTSTAKGFAAMESHFRDVIRAGGIASA